MIAQAKTTTSGAARGRFAAISERFFAFMTAWAEKSHLARCAAEAQWLGKLSDAELASLGIRREDIVRHAFRAYAHI